jgi:SynChlorMet cassette protein ScmC
VVSYHIDLSDKISITFISTNATRDLVSHLAKILNLNLSTSTETCCIFICTSIEWQNFNRKRENFILGDQWKTINIRSRIRVWKGQNNSDYIFELLTTREELMSNDKFRIGIIATILGAIWVLFSDSITILHGALVTKDEQAVVIVGPSGGGKSTAAIRIPFPWKAISDDTTAVIKNSHEQYRILGLPTWSAYFDKPGPGRSVDLNKSYPLKKIFFLEISKEDACIPVSISDAVNRIVLSSFQVYAMYWDKLSFEEVLELKKDLLMNAKDIVLATDPAILQVSKDGKFWEHME